MKINMIIEDRQVALPKPENISFKLIIDLLIK